MDLHTAGNHCDHRLSVTDGVCQHCTCSLCFHLAIKPVGSCRHRDQFTIWMIVVRPCVRVCVCNSSKYLPVGHRFTLPPRIHLTQCYCEAEKTWGPLLAGDHTITAEN